MPRTVEELFREEGVRIYNLLLRLTGNREDAADLTQEVFLRAGRALDTFEGRSAVSTWLIRIAINAGRDHLRRRKRAPRSYEVAVEDGSLAEPASPHDRTDRGIEVAEASRVVAEALPDLEPEARTILLLREAEGLSYQEMAEVLGIPVGTVQSRLFRAREALRKAVERRHPDWRP